MTGYLKPMFYTPITRWVPAFAWRPINTDDYGWVWLRSIHKRRIQSKPHLSGPLDIAWQYARNPKETQ